MTNTQTSRPTHRHRLAMRVVVALLVLASLVLALPTTTTTTTPPVQAMATASSLVPPMGDPMADDLVPWDISDGALEEFRVALIEAGFSGRDDGTDDLIYAPVFMVLDVPGGTWTTTPDGPKRCVDFATTGAECSDGVYLYWHPDYIGD